MLAKFSLEPEEIDRLTTTVAKLAGDEEASERGRAPSTSANATREGEAMTELEVFSDYV
jgi:hypothetical protein